MASKTTDPADHRRCEHPDDAETRAACEAQAREWDAAMGR